MKIKIIALVSIIATIIACNREENLTSYVNLKIGSGGHGHVFVGANVPFGMVQLGPTSIPQTWDWCSGYHSSDSTVIGFSHTHLEGTGIGDLFDITVMPVVGKVQYGRGTIDNITSGQGSYAQRSKEIAKPGYYSVPLLRYGIKAELTATKRVGFHRYTFPASDSSAIIFDMINGGCWDKPTKTYIKVIDDKTIEGYRFSTGWAKNQKIFFYARFSKAFKMPPTIIKNINSENKADTTTNISFARFNFNTKENEQILLKVGLSSVSTKGAKLNLEAELRDWDFEACADKANKEWNKALNKIKIETKNRTNKIIFYTSLFHSQIHPALFSDVNKDYRGADDKIHNGAEHHTYTIFSLWDTYRAEMPLLCIIQPRLMNSLINTMLNIYEQQGKLPVWHLMGNETDCMVGNPGIIPVADAIVKGFKGFDQNKAYIAMKNSAMRKDRGQEYRMEYGYIPADKFNESVAYDMEYAIADAAIANTAQLLGKTEDYNYFKNRSLSFKNYFDPQTLFIRGKNSDGKFVEPFNPYLSNHREDVYCEGNAWQYTWLAPQAFDELVKLYGSKEKLIERLDSLFSAKSEIEGENASSDISGLIGQYAHGNEPSHHIIYFYTMAGQLAKASDKIREVLSTMYFNNENGLSGNEDEGQMSAWYILSSLGFYQVEPASTKFFFGSPIFDLATIKVPNGKFVIKTINNGEENKYIQRVYLNGNKYDKSYIDYKDIMKGGTLEFFMDKTPVEND